ncbi:hypothetical protein JOF55_000310 [Haloactinomyces albus]|uniref:Uncharacterized protein n=1 Tax=Haloactinomyces albus TaxID=1352928 RepID=A0AAE4CJW2_9ACTN|nr:hypothetical protein [Haloactinomyces albus]
MCISGSTSVPAAGLSALPLPAPATFPDRIVCDRSHCVALRRLRSARRLLPCAEPPTTESRAHSAAAQPPTTRPQPLVHSSSRPVTGLRAALSPSGNDGFGVRSSRVGFRTSISSRRFRPAVVVSPSSAPAEVPADREEIGLSRRSRNGFSGIPEHLVRARISTFPDSPQSAGNPLSTTPEPSVVTQRSNRQPRGDTDNKRTVTVLSATESRPLPRLPPQPPAQQRRELRFFLDFGAPAHHCPAIHPGRSHGRSVTFT